MVGTYEIETASQLCEHFVCFIYRIEQLKLKLEIQVEIMTTFTRYHHAESIKSFTMNRVDYDKGLNLFFPLVGLLITN